jgi:recombinational DNA repair protein (RecF pathway)
MVNLLVYATALQAKWEQGGDPPAHCEHLSQVASLVVLSKDGYVTSTYHCRECGEALAHTYKVPPSSYTPLID